MNKSIFISYCWDDKETAQKIDADMTALGFKVTIDERNLKHKDGVKKFMESIKIHDFVITVISDSYLKSYNCLYEVGSLMEDQEYRKKTIQIFLPNANIFKKSDKYTYFNYWEKEIKELEKLLKPNVSLDKISLIEADLKETKKIRENLPKFIEFLVAERGFIFSDLENDNYQELLKYIDSQDNKTPNNSINENEISDIPVTENEISNNPTKENETPDVSTEKPAYKPVTPSIFQSEKGITVIGLTGRTGSGCTETAKWLSKSTFDKFNAPPIKSPMGTDGMSNDERKYAICYNYLSKNWTQALHIKVTHLIIWLLLQKDNFDKFIQWSTSNSNLMDENMKKIVDDKNIMETLKTKLEEIKATTQAEETYKLLFEKEYEKNRKPFDDIYNFIDALKGYYETLKKDTIGKKFIPIFQLFGNWLRDQSLEDEENEYSIVGLVHKVIHFYKYKNKYIVKPRIPTLIVIDALRNPYEILFFRKKYSSFYSMAISTNEEHREKRLSRKYDEDEIKAFSEIEYPTNKPSLREIYARQNIEKCMEMSDIHIVNDGQDKNPNIKVLKTQLIVYLSLMKHPGLVTPTHQERTMQIAFTAKYNSGCLSRQVGAVVTDAQFAIKTIGWNTVPEGQVPCLLRNCNTLLSTQSDDETDDFSSFEVKKEFTDSIKKYFGRDRDAELEGRNLSYCFKDVKGDNNPIHTRALHAEENAFLQIVKHGGQGIKGGCLFTTASPCELCAKKAYQLGISKIYYIDIYPGITQDHILKCGREHDDDKKKYNKPEMILFKGAVGRAYISLYSPIVAYKDEIYDILNIKKSKNEKYDCETIKKSEDEKYDRDTIMEIFIKKDVQQLTIKELSDELSQKEE
ncbi:hypothetical protein FACS189423_09700 [Bacteroidia bacterium]|nr:hypothetical protein FACS189423_09700 [Bacteroidia bacterium]